MVNDTNGKGDVIGAGAVVKEDVKEYSLVVGVPAKFVKDMDGVER